MFNNKWSAIRERNKEKTLALKEENRRYINSVIGYCNSQGTGLMECEITKRDLIGMAQESETEGVLLENRLGNVEEFGKSLSAEGQKIFSKERWYYFLWQYGFCLMIASGGYMFITGTGGMRNTTEFIIWFLMYSLAIVFNDMFLRNRFALKKGAEHYIGSAIHVIFIFFITMFLLGGAAMGHPVPEALYWLILLTGIIMYGGGRILFFRYINKMAKEYNWDLDSLV